MPSAARPRTDPDARRAELADAAVRAIRTVGADASMADIAAEAGITKPVLYHHFGDKAGLASAIGDRFLAELGTSLEEIFAGTDDPRAAVAQAIDVFVTFAEREPALHRFLVEGSQGTGRAPGELPVLPALAAQVAAFMVTGFGAQGSAAELEVRSIAVMGAVFEGVGWWLEGRTLTHGELVDTLADLVCNGLGGAPPT
ncbi:MAG: TetR/AcrR family transcriptional regulator [Acidimicrobiales bacterium]|nr:TetR/AcrR family transcriptional regulator [Acidimicrobiales bacterium]MCB9372135.1 TetR/AcrR family transcriptional regulator [Microthrixaceae bacterium]